MPVLFHVLGVLFVLYDCLGFCCCLVMVFYDIVKVFDSVPLFLG